MRTVVLPICERIGAAQADHAAALQQADVLSQMDPWSPPDVIPETVVGLKARLASLSLHSASRAALAPRTPFPADADHIRYLQTEPFHPSAAARGGYFIANLGDDVKLESMRDLRRGVAALRTALSRGVALSEPPFEPPDGGCISPVDEDGDPSGATRGLVLRECWDYAKFGMSSMADDLEAAASFRPGSPPPAYEIDETESRSEARLALFVVNATGRDPAVSSATQYRRLQTILCIASLMGGPLPDGSDIWRWEPNHRVRALVVRCCVSMMAASNRRFERILHSLAHRHAGRLTALFASMAYYWTKTMPDDILPAPSPYERVRVAYGLGFVRLYANAAAYVPGATSLLAEVAMDCMCERYPMALAKCEMPLSLARLVATVEPKPAATPYAHVCKAALVLACVRRAASTSVQLSAAGRASPEDDYSWDQVVEAVAAFNQAVSDIVRRCGPAIRHACSNVL